VIIDTNGVLPNSGNAPNTPVKTGLSRPYPVILNEKTKKLTKSFEFSIEKCWI
jgi:hypothetical protein